jgi:hypothetical protein
MLDESPLRTIANLFGINQMTTGTVEYTFSPLMSEDMERSHSEVPLMGMVTQWVNMQNDGITEFSQFMRLLFW